MRIAALIATYNPDKFLLEQINSIKNQDEEIDIYILDDCSNSLESKDLLSQLKKQVKSINFNDINLGPKETFFSLINQVKKDYDYYFLSDQDDIWLPNKVKLTLAKIKHHSTFLAVSSYHVGNHKGEIKKTVNIGDVVVNELTSFFYMPSPGCTFCFDKKMLAILNKHILFNEDLISMHDRWIFILARHYGTIVYLANPTIIYRQHAKNVVGTDYGAYKKLQRYFFKTILIHEHKKKLDLIFKFYGELDHKSKSKINFRNQNKIGLMLIFIRNINLKFSSKIKIIFNLSIVTIYYRIKLI